MAKANRHPGQLDKRVYMVTITTSDNSLGEAVETGTTEVEKVAMMSHKSFTEDEKGDQVVGVDTVYWVVRYDASWTRTKELRYDGDRYEVEGVREVLRRRYLELRTKRIA